MVLTACCRKDRRRLSGGGILRRPPHKPSNPAIFGQISSFEISHSVTHTRFTGTAGRVHCVRIFTHFPCYEPARWSLNFMHFQTSVIRLVDRLTWFYRFGITLQINLSPKVCDLSVMFWINIYKLGLKIYPLKSRNFGNLVCLYLGYHGNYTRFICF